MELLKGRVQDPGFPDTEITYIKTDDGKTYFFIENGTLKNGNYIATPILKEGIGHAPYTTLGLVSSSGDVLIPFENKNIQPLSNNLLLVERNKPITDSVVSAIQKQNNPQEEAELANNSNTIKEQIRSVMGSNGNFIFDNQFSEAALYTVDGVNLANNYFSFIGAKDGAYFMSTNVLGSPISKYDPYAFAMENENSEQTQSTNSNEQTEQTQTTTDAVSDNINLNINEQEFNQDPGYVPIPSIEPEFDSQSQELSNENNNQASNDENMQKIKQDQIPNNLSNEVQQENPLGTLGNLIPQVGESYNNENESNTNVNEGVDDSSISPSENTDLSANINIPLFENNNFATTEEENSNNLTENQNMQVDMDSNVDNNIPLEDSNEINETSTSNENDSETVPPELNIGFNEEESNTNDESTEETNDDSNEENTDEDDTYEEEDEEENTESDSNEEEDDDDDEYDEEDEEEDEDTDSNNIETNNDESDENEEDKNESSSNDTNNLEDTSEDEDNKLSDEEYYEEKLENPIIASATNTIKKLLEENRKQRQQLDQLESELYTLKTSNEMLEQDNASKTKEIISLRNTLGKSRRDNTDLLRENNHLKSINSRQEEMMEHIKEQNSALKEQVAGISALNSAVAEANSLFGPDLSDSYSNEYGYLDNDKGYQYTKVA